MVVLSFKLFFQGSDESEVEMDVTSGLGDKAHGDADDAAPDSGAAGEEPDSGAAANEADTGAAAAEAAHNGVFPLMMNKYREILQTRKQVHLEELERRFQTNLNLGQVPLKMAIEKLRLNSGTITDPEKKSKLEKELSGKLKALEELVKDITATYNSDKAIAQRSCLTLDGETSHCDYFYDSLTKAPTPALEQWESTSDQALKLYRGPSLKYQVLDQSSSFPDMHTLFKDVSVGVYRLHNPPAPDARVENFIQKYSPPSQVLRAHPIPVTPCSRHPRYTVLTPSQVLLTPSPRYSVLTSSQALRSHTNASFSAKNVQQGSASCSQYYQ